MSAFWSCRKKFSGSADQFWLQYDFSADSFHILFEAELKALYSVGGCIIVLIHLLNIIIFPHFCPIPLIYAQQLGP